MHVSFLPVEVFYYFFLLFIYNVYCTFYKYLQFVGQNAYILISKL